MSRLAILEAALDQGLGRKYGHTGTDTQDCVRFAEAILIQAFPWVDWSETHSDLMIMDARRPFSNVERLARLGFQEVPCPAHGHFHLCQGWRANGAGHCFFWWEPPAPSTMSPMILEATNGTSDWYRPGSWPERVSRYDAGIRLVRL